MWPTCAYGNPFLSDSESLKETRERKGVDEMKGILLYFFSIQAWSSTKEPQVLMYKMSDLLKNIDGQA